MNIFRVSYQTSSAGGAKKIPTRETLADTTNERIIIFGKTHEFEETDEHDDLPLGGLGDGVPSLRRGSDLRERIPREGHRPRPRDAVGVNDVPHEREHGHAAVLHLGLPEEADRGFVRRAPEFGPGEVQRIEVLDGGVQLLRERLEVGLRLRDGGSRRCPSDGGGGGEGRGGAQDGGEEGELHHRRWCLQFREL